MCITEATTALTLRVYALISICRPSCPSMVAHGVRTMKRSHLPPRPANTLPDPHRKSGVWADVAPQCEPSCQTASILQTRSNPSRSTFPPSSWTPPPPSPSLFLYSQFLSHPPFLFPRFSYLLLYLCGLSLSLFYSVSPRSPVLSSSSALRSSFIVHSWPSVYTNRASSSNQRPVDYTLSNLVDTRTPFLVVFLFVPSSGLSSRRGRRPASSGRANLFSADAITRSDAHATLFPLEMVLCDVCDNKGERSLVVGGNVVTLFPATRSRTIDLSTGENLLVVVEI